MSKEAPKPRQKSPDNGRVSSVSTSRIPQLARISHSGLQRNIPATPTRSTPTAFTPSPQSRIATPRPPSRSVLSPREPNTPRQKDVIFSDEIRGSTTKVSPGGGMYQLHPTSIGPGLSRDKWIRIVASSRSQPSHSGPSDSFQHAILLKLTEKSKHLEESQLSVKASATQKKEYNLGSPNAKSTSLSGKTKPVELASINAPINGAQLQASSSFVASTEFSQASRRDAIYLAQVQALTKDSFKWLEETLEAEGITVDDDPASPKSAFSLLTPIIPNPLLPSPIILDDCDRVAQDGGTTGLGLDVGVQFIDPFAASSPSHPTESVYLSPRPSPEATPKATFYSRSNGKFPPTEIVANTDRKQDSIVPPGSGEFYLHSLASSWDGDYLTRYPPFPGASAHIDQFKRKLTVDTSSVTVSSIVKPSPYPRFKRSGSEPTILVQRTVDSTPSRVRANSSAVDSQGNGNKGFLQQDIGHNIEREGPCFVTQPRLPSENVISTASNCKLSSPRYFQRKDYTPTTHSRLLEEGVDGSQERISYREQTKQIHLRTEMSRGAATRTKEESMLIPNASESHPDPHPVPGSSALATKSTRITNDTFIRRPVPPETVKKARNFSLPTRPSMFLGFKNTSTAVTSDLLPPPLPLSCSLPLPTTQQANSDTNVDVASKFNAPSLRVRVLTGTWSILRALDLSSSSDANSAVHKVSSISPTSLPTTDLHSNAETSASGLSRFRSHLPIGISGPNTRVVPTKYVHTRKASEQCVPKTVKRSLYSRPLFSKSLPHIPRSSQHPSPTPPIPKNVMISAEARARYGSIYGTEGSPRGACSHPNGV